MSSFFDENKDRYMELLFRISAEGAWEEWITFCLTGVIETAHDTGRRCDRLLDLHRQFHAQLRAGPGSVRLAAMVDDLFITPVASVSKLAERHHVTYPTARADLKRLEKAGIVRALENTTRIAYYRPAIMDVTYAD